MEEIIVWLMEIELLAENIYLQSASYFSDDRELHEFLEMNARDEASHYQVIANAAEYFKSISAPVPAISIDNETSERILSYFTDISDGINSDSIRKDALLTKIVEAELSEWNDIFLYVVNYLKSETNEFSFSAKKIQTHKKQILSFFENFDFGRDILTKLRTLPDIWTANILIVDDDRMITEVLKAILNKDGNIDIAPNGAEALKYVADKSYQLIISDVDMPVMDGLTFYEHAVEVIPSLKNRFLFITGEIEEERKSYFSDHGLQYLVKPMPINQLRNEALKILFAS